MAEALDPAVPPDVDDLAKAVLRQADTLGVSLVTAESCTGGMLASLLTDIPGLSHVFERGYVTYTDEAKRALLDVPADVLETDGAVSERAARAMAEGALRDSHAGLAVSITGFCEASPEGPAGLVHFACAAPGRPTTHMRQTYGDVGRAEVRRLSLRTALGMMKETLDDG